MSGEMTSDIEDLRPRDLEPPFAASSFSGYLAEF
jgi:hypothetical protein